MSKITRSLSWNTRRKQQRGQDGGADGGEGAEHGTLSPGNGNGVGPSTDGSNGVASMPSEEAYRPSSTPRSLVEAARNMFGGGGGAAADDGGTTPRSMEVDSADLIAQNPQGGARQQVRTWSFSRRARKGKNTQIEEPAAPEGQAKVYFLDCTHKLFDTSPSTTVGTLLADVKARLGLALGHSFALYQVQRGTHYLLHENAMIAEIRSATDSRAKALGMKERRPKLLFNKYLFTKQDERLVT